MKKSSEQRIKHTIKTYQYSIVFNIIFLTWFIIFILLYIKPNYIEIENIKQNLVEVINQKKVIEKDWLTFSEFLWLREWVMSSIKGLSDNDKNIINSLKKMDWEWNEDPDRDFFDIEFINNTEANYDDFLKSKDSEIIKKEEEMLEDDRFQKMKLLIPSYADSWIAEETDLSDVKFVNYIERIIYTFNLTTDTPISIELKPLPNLGKDSKTRTSMLESSVFVIPLNLKLTWKKSDILNFIYYFENVWWISMEWDDDIKVKDALGDKFFGEPIALVWEYLRDSNGEETIIPPSYNLYDHQFAEIKSLSIDDYIVSTDISMPKKIDFYNFLKEKEWDYKMNAEIELYFYVKWLPNYEIQSFVMNVNDEFNSIKKEAETLMKKIESNSRDKMRYAAESAELKTIKFFLDSKQKEIDALVKSKQINISQYEKALEIRGKLNFITKEITDIKEIMGLIKHEDENENEDNNLTEN